MIFPLLLLYASGYILEKQPSLQAPDEEEDLAKYLERNFPASSSVDALLEDILLNSDFNEDIPVFSSLETSPEMVGILSEDSSTPPHQVTLIASTASSP